MGRDGREGNVGERRADEPLVPPPGKISGGGTSHCLHFTLNVVKDSVIRKVIICIDPT